MHVAWKVHLVFCKKQERIVSDWLQLTGFTWVAAECNEYKRSLSQLDEC